MNNTLPKQYRIKFPLEKGWHNGAYSSEDLHEGQVVTEFVGCTYGCVGENGVAVTCDGVEGYFEVPANSIEPLN